jgi:tetratricopeptide (TPR) repeat protein
MPDSFELLRAGLAHHQAGRLQEAEAAYRAVLGGDKLLQAKALYLLGVLCTGSGRLDEAIGLLQRAVAADPEDTDARFNFGNALYRKGDLQAALAQYRIVVEQRPGYGDVYANMGRVYLDCGDIEAALIACRTAVARKPALAEGHTNLGLALLGAGRIPEAIEAFQAALARQPQSAAAHANLANALTRAHRFGEAVDEARAALARDPDLADAYVTSGSALRELGRNEEAIAALRRAIELTPDSAPAHANLGNALLEQDDTAAAEAQFRRAIELNPNLAEAHSGLGYLLTNAKRFPEAIAACERAIALRPDFAEAHWNEGFAYLLAGDFEHGWEKYEWRKRHPRYAAAYRSFDAPTWEGEDLAGRTLMIHAEQGLGDSIQFIRYAEPLAARGARVVVACDRALIDLFRRVRGVADAVDKNGAMPPFDVWIDQMSLPRVTRTRLDSIPAPDAYLSADPARVAAWRHELPQDLKIGLVWAGNPTHSNDRRRSMPVEAMRPVVAVSGPTFVSLQVGTKSREVERLPGVLDIAGRLTDFMATAAVVETLDLVIAVDTAVTHLAAAMGKPAWTLLPFDPDWRWVVAHPDTTPWYPSMRLFRQSRSGDWDGVAARVAAAVRALAAGDRTVLRPRSP